jgi:hypothetical protein
MTLTYQAALSDIEEDELKVPERGMTFNAP